MSNKHSIFKVASFIDSLYLYDKIGFQGLVDTFRLNPFGLAEISFKTAAFVSAAGFPYVASSFQFDLLAVVLIIIGSSFTLSVFTVVAATSKKLEKQAADNKGANPFGPHWLFVMARAGLLSLFIAGTLFVCTRQEQLPNPKDNFSALLMAIVFITWVACSFLSCHLPDRRVLPHGDN